jgi:hypothetical protein
MIKNEKGNTKKNVSTRGNFRTKKKVKAKPQGKTQGIKDYYAQRLQDSQTFSRINRDRVTDSLVRASGLFSPKEQQDQQEAYEYKPIDSQIGSLMKQREYSVDRAQLRNQRNNGNLASLVVSGIDSAISPNPRRPYANDNLMFKSMIKTKSPMSTTMYNAKSMVGTLNDTQGGTLDRQGERPGEQHVDRPGVRSPGKDSRNIKLDPINLSKSLLHNII